MDCHEPDGRGEFSREAMRAIPDFTKPQWQIKHSDAQWLRAIREGKGSMPAFRDKLGTTDIVRLVTFIRDFRDGRQVVADGPADQEKASPELENEKPAAHTNLGVSFPQSIARATREPGALRAVAARGPYQRFCASCHGADGRGSASRALTPELPDFTSPAWHQRRSDAQMTVSISEGKGKAMPGFHGRLDDTQVRNLVALVRTFGPAVAPIESNRETWTDFNRRYQRLQDEIDEVKRQYQALSSH
jgi:mono/diheme cytochrome c family protein